MGINPFVANPSVYGRNIDIMGGYVDAVGTAIHARHPQFDLDYCKKYVKDGLKVGGNNELKDPKIAFISQRKRGMRRMEQSTVLSFLGEIREQTAILAPSLIAYQQPEVVKSLLSEFLFGNIRQRKIYKDQMFKYIREGNNVLSAFYNIMQGSTKENNNSLSGAALSKFNAIYCKSSHLSLTSGCRSATSYANASNERFIAGNRHYHEPYVVIQELSNAMLYAPHKEIAMVLDKYGIKYPTDEDVFTCLNKSTRKYWYSEKEDEYIRAYIRTMTKEAKAAFVYVGDAYHLELFNPGFMEKIIKNFTDLDQTFDTFLEDDYLDDLDGDKIATISLLRSNLLVGKSLKDLKEKYPDDYNQINTTAGHFEKSIENYADFIDALWRPRYLQSSIGKFRSIMREAVLTSDTDSTIFTTMYWTNKVTGDYDFTKLSYNVAYVMVYFASQIVSNSLLLLCANMGVKSDKIDMLKMKNEFFFPVYGLTNISKHYFALMSAQEGVVMKHPELEMKGVHLISSKASAKFMSDFKDYIQGLLEMIMAGKQPSYDDIMTKPIEEELKIRANIRTGDIDYYTREQIKNPENYKNGEDNSNYFQYLFWRDVFAAKYGDVDTPPLAAMKIPVDLNKPRKLKEWIEGMDDVALSGRMKEFLTQKDKGSFTSILVPQAIVLGARVPEELMGIIDENRAVSQIMSPYYLALQSMGYYVGNDKYTRLLTDNYIDEYMASQVS